jgi:low temperature requirement protein LtrA
MYGGYAWLTNQVHPDRPGQRLLLVAGMAAFMVCALAVPGAFEDTGLAFGVGYLLVVAVHAVIYLESAGIGVLRFVPLNLVGALALIGASFVDGPARYLLWLSPLALQYLTSILVRRVAEPGGTGFGLHPVHFVERHGLLLIVALGESVVAVGIGLGEAELDFGNYLAAALGLAVAAGLWCVYFDQDADRAEAALHAAGPRDRMTMALNGYFYAFIPMLLGVIVLAAGTAHAVANVGERIDWPHAWLLAAGGSLYLVGDVAFRSAMHLQPVAYRALAAVAMIATIVVGHFVSALAQLVALVLVVALALVSEQRLAAGARGRAGPGHDRPASA